VKKTAAKISKEKTGGLESYKLIREIRESENLAAQKQKKC